MERNRRTTVRSASATLVGLVLASALVLPGSVVSAGAATVERPEGAGPPVAASGMGTQAALDNPRCQHDDPTYGPYGRFDSTSVGGGPACVKAWKEGADNGGATAQGVTKDRVKVVVRAPQRGAVQERPGEAARSGFEHHGHLPGRSLRLPHSRARVSTRRGVVTRGALLHVERLRRAVPAFGHRGDQGVEAVRGGESDQRSEPQGARNRVGGGEDPHAWATRRRTRTRRSSRRTCGARPTTTRPRSTPPRCWASSWSARRRSSVVTPSTGQTRKIGVVSDGSIDDALFVDAFRDFGGKVTETGTVPASTPGMPCRPRCRRSSRG